MAKIQTKACSESQSVRLAAKCTPYVCLLDDRDQVLKTHTHTHTHTHTLSEDQIKHLHLKDTGGGMQVPP